MRTYAALQLPPPSSETDNVKVFVRTRPINEREVEFGASLNPHISLCLQSTAWHQGG